ncbi:hypothetical protein CEY04_19640 [Achromobacter sp. HZ28]|nr:hypothetical protein CEY04_19640 [Achromobacter sp. HZ28]OWT76413.1 hypothetical protein CEY05_15090 [Achromobacter sp. HZ34]
MVTGENSNFVFNPRPPEETPSQPWYSGIGSFVAAQLNRLRDGFNAMREMIFPASAQTNPPAAANDTYATANRSIPQTPEEIAVTTLDIGLNIAKSGRKDVQKVAGMDEFRGLKFRGLTSMYDLLDPRNNAFKTRPAVGTTAPSAQEQSKPAAQEAFRNVLTQAEQDSYWDAQKVLKPLGHTLGNGSRAINALEDPADFAAFQKQVLDAFDISIVAMEKVKGALSPETETSPA